MNLSNNKQKKYEASRKKIKSTFLKIKSMGISNKKSGRQNSDNTIEQYEALMLNYAERLKSDFGIVDITRAKKEHFEKYLNEGISKYGKGDLRQAHSLNKLISAIEMFREGSKETGIFKKEVELIDKESARETMQYFNVKRLSESTETMSIEEDIGKQIALELLNSRSPNKEEVKKAWELAQASGARAMDVLSMTAKDVEENGCWIRNSKGGLTSFVPYIDHKEKAFIQGLAKDRKDDAPLIQMKKKDGKVMSKDSMKSLLEREVKKAGERVMTVREQVVHYKFRGKDGKLHWKSAVVDQKIKFHSSRKAFVNKRFDFYNRLDEEELQKLLDERFKDENVHRKYQTAEKRINDTRKKSSPRGLYRYEKALFLSSIDSRHFRIDIMRSYYLSREKVNIEREVIKLEKKQRGHY